MKLFIILFLIITSINAQETLKIAGWDVYSDPDNPSKTIGYESFEKEFNIKIEFKPLSNLNDIVEASESSADYDLFIISNEGISILHDMELASPLNLNLLPEYQSLHPSLRYTKWGQFNGNVYAVPWAWGPTGLMYDADVMSMPTSWNVLWDKKYIGKVAMWDDVSIIWTTALSLGFKNVYSLTKSQLSKVKAKLLEFNKLKAHYYAGGGDEINLIKDGKIVAYNSWYNPSARLKKLGKNFSMNIPKEGAVGMFDSYMIRSDSKHKVLAHKYINHQIMPNIQKSMTRITGLAPSNIETLGLLNRDEIKFLHLDEQDYFSKMILWDHMPRKNLYEKLLNEIKKDYSSRTKN
ncbi:extracellular solute-binding protein [Sulfurimonas sp.]|nr:extracellular solute-binding protein [Sulfurimonas sp.]